MTNPATNPANIATSNEQFAIPGIAQIVPGNGNLPKIQITSPAASAEIYLYGAHLTSWHPAGAEEVLFLSEYSRFEEGKAIRGGIPICFPWFRAKADDPKAPAHGFARIRPWELESIAQAGEAVIVTLTTAADDSTRQWWPHDFRAIYRVHIGSELKLELSVINTGSEAFHFEEALHTYNRVGDAEVIRIAGLDAVAYLDNRDNNHVKLQSGEIQFTAATDNAYINTEDSVVILDPVMGRRIRLDKQNSLTTVVWNPWSDGAAALSDMGNGEWHQMACVEASNILSSAITLQPGRQHTITAIIRINDNAEPA